MRESGFPDWENLTTEQYFDIATGHDIDAWQSQQEAFAGLRDLCEEIAAECRTETERLREVGEGGAVRALRVSFGRILSALEALGGTAASNSDGMREMAAAMRELDREAHMLRSEDQEWQRNPDGDDRDTVRRLRDSLRGELRDKVIESGEQFQRLAASYLLPPPEAPSVAELPKTGGHAPESAPPTEPKSSDTSPAQDPAPQAIGDALGTRDTQDTRSGGPPRLQSGPLMEPTPPPQQAPLPADAPAPMMPMGGEVAAGASSGGGAGRSGGPAFEEVKQRSGSRMRSAASRQELRNQSRYGEYQRPDPRRQRRVGSAEEDSPFASDAQVVPPVVSGSPPPVGPHDSGPVVTGTVYRYFPGYGALPQSPEFDETFDDGTRAEVQVPEKHQRAAASDMRSVSQSQPRSEAVSQEPSRSDSAPAHDDTNAAPDAGSSRESLAEQRRRRREARQQRRLVIRDGDEE